MSSYSGLLSIPEVMSEWAVYETTYDVIDAASAGGPVAGPSAPRAMFSSSLAPKHTMGADALSHSESTSSGTPSTHGLPFLPTEWGFFPDLPILPFMPFLPPMALPMYAPPYAPIAPPSSDADRVSVKRNREEDAVGSSEGECRPTKVARRHKIQQEIFTCGWKCEHDSICGYRGISQEVWQHLRVQHEQKPAKIAPIPKPVVCGWNGCTHRGLPRTLTEHWLEVHKSACLADSELNDGLMACRVCHSTGAHQGVGNRRRRGHMKLASLPKHLRTTHWGVLEFCDNCGRESRSDVFDKGDRDHRGQCLLVFMRDSPHCI
ncbi:uncharacterized protein C8Q71DRAFT_768826 [Rhodofomes roseus]|uniref:C2H2-type domain-containing protein n=1 Tax=Rhodofomes roseus TaxID=34475 RepID=A0ABQ8KAE2_9APHY|nr:uncharacterized protein C8Q71DRAFT_768826 [Rhodofomes roseus]KAH9834440.1 hypothetical protein C8Q71DRAFT_768826 [Rhodofomes roseus]